MVFLRTDGLIALLINECANHRVLGPPHVVYNQYTKSHTDNMKKNTAAVSVNVKVCKEIIICTVYT